MLSFYNEFKKRLDLFVSCFFSFLCPVVFVFLERLFTFLFTVFENKNETHLKAISEFFFFFWVSLILE